jgi:hypothetical protein
MRNSTLSSASGFTRPIDITFTPPSAVNTVIYSITGPILTSCCHVFHYIFVRVGLTVMVFTDLISVDYILVLTRAHVATLVY